MKSSLMHLSAIMIFLAFFALNSGASNEKPDIEKGLITISMTYGEFKKEFSLEVPVEILGKFAISNALDTDNPKVGSPIDRYVPENLFVLQGKNIGFEKIEIVSDNVFLVSEKGKQFWANNEKLSVQYLARPLFFLKMELLCYLIENNDLKNVQIYKTLFDDVFNLLPGYKKNKFGEPILNAEFAKSYRGNKSYLLYNSKKRKFYICGKAKQHNIPAIIWQTLPKKISFGWRNMDAEKQNDAIKEAINKLNNAEQQFLKFLHYNLKK